MGMTDERERHDLHTWSVDAMAKRERALVVSMLAATLGQEMIVRWFPPPRPQIILQSATP